jgi:hypothetical protein
MQTMKLPFSTFEELLNVGTHVVGVVNNSAAIWLFSVRRKSVTSLITCSQFLHAGSGQLFLLGSQMWLFCNRGPMSPTRKIMQLKFIKIAINNLH